MCVVSFFFFFFKQKTAYEIYQCDWSSDVCSSDLGIYLVIDPNQGEDAGYGVTVPYYGTNIQCHLLEKSDSSALANGQKATIKGQVDDMSLGIVQLKNCSLVK